MPADIQLQRVPMARGFTWLRQGLRVFAHRPLAFSLLLSTVVFSQGLILSVPLLGPFVAAALLPLVWLGFMIASQVALRGQVPLPDVFIVPLKVERARSIALLKLCLGYLAGLILISLLSHWLDGGAMFKLMRTISEQKLSPAEFNAMLDSGDLQNGVFIRVGLLMLLAVPFWHAPALVHWGGHTASKAMFFSIVAVWRAKWAFVAHGATCLGAVLSISVLSAVVLGLLGHPEWTSFLAMPLGLMFASVFSASLFFTFVDAFVTTEGPPAPLPADPPPPAGD